MSENLLSKRGHSFHTRNALSIIALFVGVVEAAFAYPVTQLDGVGQLIMVFFMVLFPVLVAAAFFFILIKYPENLYSPSDFDNSDIFMRLVEQRAMRVKEQLITREKQIDEMIASYQKTIKEFGESFNSIATKVEKLPELDRERLISEFTTINDCIDGNLKKMIDYYTTGVQIYQQSLFMGVRDVAFNVESFGRGNYSLDFLIEAAVTAIHDLQERNETENETDGSIRIDDGDFETEFAYKLDPKHSRL
jgi:hypothetical protein